MLKYARGLAAICTAAILSTSAIAGEQRVTSLNWQPYTGDTLPKGGVLVDILRQALAANGDQLAIEYLPWARAKANAVKDENVLGYYPAWPSDIEPGFFASSIVFKSPIGFVQRKEAPMQWETLDDLKGKSIIVVESYGYPEDFEALLTSGDVKVTRVVDDATVVRMVAGGRADIGAVDPFVMAHSLNSDPKMTAIKDTVEYNAHHLIEYPLVLALRDTPANRDVAQALEAALDSMPVDQMVADAFK